MRYLFPVVIIVILNSGCLPSGNKGFEYIQNNYIVGMIEARKKPFKFKDSDDYKYFPEYDAYCQLSRETDGYGKYYYENCVKEDEGLTHITRGDKGDLIYHWFSGTYVKKGSPSDGECKFYYIVNPKTHIIKDWKYDIKNGGNPKSCVVGP